jgi:hypothetical protein
MNKLELVLVVTAVSLAGCNRGSDEATAQRSVADQAAELEKQAEIQAAVGDKAGAQAMMEKAAALRAAMNDPAAGHAGD